MRLGGCRFLVFRPSLLQLQWLLCFAFLIEPVRASVGKVNKRMRGKRGGRDAHRDAVDARKGGGVAEREEERKIGGALRGNGRPWTNGQWT